MTSRGSIVVLGRTRLDKDETEAVREIGQAFQVLDKQLYTTMTDGVGFAVAAGYRSAGGTPHFIKGTPPEDADYLILADNAYLETLRSRRDIPDHWIIAKNEEQLYEAHHAMLVVLSDKGLSLPQYRGGVGVPGVMKAPGGG